MQVNEGGLAPYYGAYGMHQTKKRLGNTILIFHTSLDNIMCRVLDPDGYS